MQPRDGQAQICIEKTSGGSGAFLPLLFFYVSTLGSVGFYE